MGLPLFRAFLISIGLHLATFFVIETGHSVGMWKVSVIKSLPRVGPKTPDPAAQKPTPVLQFVEVDPAQVAPEEPKDTKYYSTANTAAANPDTRDLTNVPKIEGTQEKVLKTTDAGKAQPAPPPQPEKKPSPTRRNELQPDLKQAEASEPTPDSKENTLTPEEKATRDMTFDRPAQKPTPRARTLAQAREQKGIIETPKTKQDGGVSKYALESSMDVKSSPFGAYDAAFIAAVQARWFALIDARDQAITQSGKVVVDFRLYNDGRILQLRVADKSVNETYAWMCQRAILDPAPYAKFPPDLKRLVGRDYREVRFTFHYN